MREGFMAKHIIEEAKRCLQCKAPLCRDRGCPVATEIPTMIKRFLEDRIRDAGEMLFANNPLSVVCALICPVERLCEGNCVLAKTGNPIQISSIEHYISFYYLDKVENNSRKNTDKKIAIIGSGPAGITVAIMLAFDGFDITIFESEDKIGGIMRFGIPDYRLPKYLLDKYRDVLIRMGIKIRPNTLIGSVITLDDLFRDGYKAVFIGTGVWNPSPLRVKGESLGHVHYAINYLKNPDAFDLGKKVAIIGAGNVAMDVARTALRKLSEDVCIIYRHGPDAMTAEPHEIEYAKVDGARFEFFRMPVQIVEDGVVLASTTEKVDDAGNVTIEKIDGTEELFPADSIIIAVSQKPRSNIVSTTGGIKTNKFGLVVTDNDGRTTREGVFASGDVVTGAKTVVEAVHFSKRGAKTIEAFVQEKYGF
jgi:glutamate synthase (NADPH) small chain